MSPARAYLYQPRRRVELTMAVFGLSYGAFVWSVAALGLGSPLAWATEEVYQQIGLGQAFMVAALIHALGIRVNGRWRWSPFLRLVGLALHAFLVVLLLAAALPALTSAVLVYTWIVALFGAAIISAAQDCLLAMKGERRLWS